MPPSAASFPSNLASLREVSGSPLSLLGLSSKPRKCASDPSLCFPEKRCTHLGCFGANLEAEEDCCFGTGTEIGITMPCLGGLALEAAGPLVSTGVLSAFRLSSPMWVLSSAKRVMTSSFLRSCSSVYTVGPKDRGLDSALGILSVLPDARSGERRSTVSPSPPDLGQGLPFRFMPFFGDGLISPLLILSWSAAEWVPRQMLH